MESYFLKKSLNGLTTDDLVNLFLLIKMANHFNNFERLFIYFYHHFNRQILGCE